MTPRKLSRRACASLIALGIAAVVPFAVNAQVAGFRDIPKDHWAADSVARLVAVGILKGAPAAPFAPADSAASAHSTKPGYDGNKPVTRYELAVTLYRFVQYIDRADKQPKGKLPIHGEPKSGSQAVQALVASGYLPKETPLAQNGTRVVTAKQFGNALAQVIVKTREDASPPAPDSDLNIQRPENGGAARS